MSDTRERVAKWLVQYLRERDAARDPHEEEAARERFLALLSDPGSVDLLGYITRGDLAHIRRNSPGVPSVNVWAARDEGDVAIYLSPTKAERDHRAMRQAVAVLETADTALSYDDSYEGSDLEKRIVRTMQELDAILNGDESDE